MEVLITSEPEKLPDDVRVLADETRPLLPGVAFFEQRYTLAMLVRRLAGGVAFLVGGAGVMIFGGWMLVDDIRHATAYSNSTTGAAWGVIGFGAVLGLAGWLFLSSLGETWAMQRRQGTGGHIRHGIFLLPDALVSRSSFDVTVVPRASFRGLKGGAVQYEHAGQVKTFPLPGEVVGASRAQIEAAIVAWSQRPQAG